jgi:hypothetical protein
MNTLSSQLRGVLATSMKKGLQKNFLVTSRPGIQDSANVLIKGES